MYFPGWIGMKSLIGRPNMHIAGDSRVSRSGVFRYCRMARWNASVLRLPSCPVFFMISLFTVLTPISALLLLWGNATDDRRWCTPQLRKNFAVADDVNSGPPSDDSSSLIPNVVKVRLRLAMSPWDPSCALSTMGQLLYLSTITR